MTLSKQQIIDQRAQRIFEPLLPSDWIVRERTPDYRIDYVVEVFENGESTGTEFAVQLKGTKKPRIVRDTARFSIESQHLAYWVDRTRHPVFLVLLDVEKEAGWWVFVQKLVLEGGVCKPWRSQKSVTIALPLQNSLNDTALLRKSADDAVLYMSGVWPGAVETAIRAEKCRLESLDPRFEVRIHATEEGSRRDCLLTTDAPVTISIRFPPPVGEASVEELLARGEPIGYREGQMEASGSELFAEAARRSVRMQIQWHGDCDVKLCSDKGALLVGPVPGKIRGGTRDWRFEGEIGRGVFRLSTDIVRPVDAAPMIQCNWKLDLSLFDGKPLLDLPYFDQLYTFFETVAGDGWLVLEFCRDGNRIFAYRIDLSLHRSRFAGLHEFLTPVHRAREIARRFGIAPTLPTGFGPDAPVDIDHLYMLTTSGEYRLPGQAVKVTGVVVDARGLQEGKLTANPIYLGRKSVSYRVYDVCVDVEDVDLMLTAAMVDTLEREPDSTAARVSFRATKDSELVFRKTLEFDELSGRLPNAL